MSSQDKKQNVRTQKWRIMLQSGIFKDKQLLKTRIRKGIPMSIRSLAWPSIINLQKFIESKKPHYTYQSLLNSFSNNIYQITLDIPRTFPQQQDSKILRKSLNNILKSLSIIYPKIGYCQGMNFSALRLLQVFDDETAFWILNCVYEKDKSIMRNFVDPKSVERQNYIFTKLIKQKLPKFHECFQQKKVMYQAYTIKWFMTLYSSVVSQQLFYRIFQVFLNQGWSIIFAIGLALLKNRQKQILHKQTQQILFLLSSQIYHIQNIDEFMNLAYEFQITQEKVLQLGNQFDNKQMEDLRTSQKARYQREIQSREESNRKGKDLVTQKQNVPKKVVFQAKGEEVNFQIFQLLINDNNNSIGKTIK